MSASSELVGAIGAALRARPAETGWKGSEPESIRRKAEETLAALEHRGWDAGRTAFLDVGGSDGALLAHLLSTTSSSCGVLLEFEDEAAQAARRRAAALGPEKAMRVYTGDAAHKIESALQEIQRWQASGRIDRMCVTLYAVLHELADRGSGASDIEGFLSTLLHRLPVIVIAREPCVPDGMPAEVYLSIGDCPPTVLAELAERIRIEHPQTFPRRPQAMTDRVRMDGRLAIETITKAFYIRDFAYEVRERVTSLTSSDLTAAFYQVFGESSVRHENLQSASFDRKWAELRVRLRDARGQELGKPQLHIKLTAHHWDEDRAAHRPPLYTELGLTPVQMSEAPTARPPQQQTAGDRIAEPQIVLEVSEHDSSLREVELGAGDWTAGRSVECFVKLRLADERVSRNSCTFHVRQEGAWVSPGIGDVQLNGERLMETRPLAVGDVVTLAAQWAPDPTLPQILRAS